MNMQLLLMLKFSFLKGLSPDIENSEIHTILAIIDLISPSFNPY